MRRSHLLYSIPLFVALTNVKMIIALMDHVARDGTPKCRRDCTLPLTGANVVDIITDLAVFSRPTREDPFVLIELAPGTTVEHVRASTEAFYVDSRGPAALGI